MPVGKAFYCPAVLSGIYWFGAYDEAGYAWPAVPPDEATLLPGWNGNAYIRYSYSYHYAQSKTLGAASGTYGGPALPIQNYSKQTFVSPSPGDPATTITTLTPLKISQIDPAKCIATDTLDQFKDILHKNGGSPAGMDIGFPDGHVNFAPVRGNNKKGSYQPYDPNLWDPSSGAGQGPGEDPDAYRIIVNAFLP